MAELCFKDCHFIVGTSAAPTNLTDHVRAVTINYAAEMLDKTAMQDDSRSRLAGLKNWSITAEFNQDFAASEPDATLFAMVGSTARFIQVRPTTAAPGATNPRFHGKCLLESYGPIAGTIGGLLTCTATFQGDGDLTRAVTTKP